jgi:hypothetical protein
MTARRTQLPVEAAAIVHGAPSSNAPVSADARSGGTAEQIVTARQLDSAIQVSRQLTHAESDRRLLAGR